MVTCFERGPRIAIDGVDKLLGDERLGIVEVREGESSEAEKHRGIN
jgi:hypothetical protein